MSLSKEEGNLLLDFYSSLLTDKQNDVLNQYYALDYSLSEIAENLNVTKSAISDLLNRSNNQLIDYENKLKLVKKYKNRQILYDKFSNDNTKELIAKLRNLD